MAVPGIKFDDGTGGFATNCFPVRGLVNQTEEEGAGAWLVAHKAEQRRRFKAVLCAKPKTYSQIREERKRTSKETLQTEPPVTCDEDVEEEKVLDGFFLMRHCCVEDPSDLCSVNVSGQGLTDVKEEDFGLFDNVAYVNVSENVLPFETFNNFPIIRELEMQLNGLRNLKINLGEFPLLEMLDLSYNNLSPEDLLPLGLLTRLRVLHLTGNLLKTLPNNLCKPHTFPDSFEEVPRFTSLEILMLDDNKFSSVTIIAALAGLPRLHHVNLARNDLGIVPHLMLVDGRHVTQDTDMMKKHSKKTKSRQGSSRKGHNSGRKSILKNTPSLEEGPTNTPLLTRSSLSANKLTSPSPEDTSAEQHNVKFNDTDERLADGAEKMEDEVKQAESATDLGFGELNLNDIEDKIEEETFQEAQKEARRQAEERDTSATSVGRRNGTLPPPFSELRSVNLSHNQFVDEESLLAVAAWPMLREVIIHDNPLTSQKSGDPPLLKHYLGERLGINIVRKRPEGPIKPHIEVQLKPERKINTVIPPVPRCNVEELLALEGPKVFAQSGLSDKVTGNTAMSGRLDGTAALPPISPGPSELKTGEEEGKEEELLKTETSRQIDKDADAFFLTQVEDTSQQSRQKETTSPVPRPPEKPKDETRRGRGRKTRNIPDKYKGFEALLDDSIEADDEAQQLKQDLHSKVKSLQYILDHPLVFRDKPVELDQPQPPYRPLNKLNVTAATMSSLEGSSAQARVELTHPDQPAHKRKERSAQVTEVLNNLRERSTITEAGLSQVIHPRSKNKSKQFPEAQRLLTEIQNRYNVVRATSMRDAMDVILQAQDLMDEAMQGVDQIAQTTSQKA